MLTDSATRIRETYKAHETLREFMHAQIADRKRETRSGAPPRDDVFSILVRANEEEDVKYPLDDTELVSRLQFDGILYVLEYMTDFYKGWECVSAFVCWTRCAFASSQHHWHPLTVYRVTETTAHTLAATLGLLGLYQDVQDEILQHILHVVGPTQEPASLLYLVL
jgi:hypothetical protein